MKKTASLLLVIPALLATLAPLGTVVQAAESKDTTATTTFDPGALTLETAPASFQFPTSTLSATAVTSFVQNPSALAPLEISNYRGTDSGYKLTATSNPMSATDNSGKNLNGSNLFMDANYMSNPTGTIGSAFDFASLDRIYLDSLDQNQNPIPVEILEAAANTDKGLGKWSTAFENDSVGLVTQPGEASAKNYATTITWTLNDVPPVAPVVSAIPVPAALGIIYQGTSANCVVIARSIKTVTGINNFPNISTESSLPGNVTITNQSNFDTIVASWSAIVADALANGLVVSP